MIFLNATMIRPSPPRDGFVVRLANPIISDWWALFVSLQANDEIVIDTHCHIYLKEFEEDLQDAVNRAKEQGVEMLLLPNVDFETVDLMHRVEGLYPTFCRSMMGLHPTSVKDDYKEVLEKVASHLHTGNYIGIGEIGIDLYWDTTHRAEQMEAFRIQIEWAKERGLPIVIHCRDAFPEVFEVVDACMDERLRGVFHSFSGTKEDAEHILSYGSFKIGINGVVTFKNTTLREVLSDVPLSALVLETDSPYLAPVPHRGRRNEPAYLTLIAKQLAQAYNKSEEAIIEQTSQNARQLFNL